MKESLIMPAEESLEDFAGDRGLIFSDPEKEPVEYNDDLSIKISDNTEPEIMLELLE